MNIFKDFSYRLLRTFALTTLFCGFLLLYMSLKAIRGNGYFFMWSLVMFVLTVILTRQTWINYKHRPIYTGSTMEVYGSVCPKCKEMLKVDEKVCPNCGESIK